MPTVKFVHVKPDSEFTPLRKTESEFTRSSDSSSPGRRARSLSWPRRSHDFPPVVGVTTHRSMRTPWLRVAHAVPLGGGGGGDDAELPTPTLTLTQATLSIVTALLGAGNLALPYATASSGWVFLLVLVGVSRK
jgi:hypothetical protein